MMFKVNAWPKCVIFSICLFLSSAFVLSSPSCELIDVQQLYNSFDTFSKRISYEVAKTTTGNGYFISPLSIHTCMAMTRMGAMGDTAKEIDEAFALATPNRESLASAYQAILKSFQNSTTVTMANKFYIMQGYKTQESFGKLLSEQFYSDIQAINFADSTGAANTINDWVKSKTNNLITNLVAPDSFDGLTKLVLVNAIHFKANWLKKFDAKFTGKRDFYFHESKKIKVDMMFTEDNLKYGNFSDYQAVQLPYADSHYSMLIILPHSRDSLQFADLENKLQSISLPKIVQNMTINDELEIRLSLPKFKTEFEVDLIGPLKNMGIKRLFTNNAELGNILKDDNVKVSEIFHKAVIDVNEDGTEAAAATYGIAEPLIYSDPPIRFYADHPFFYNILYDDKIVLFQGKQTFGL